MTLRKMIPMLDIPAMHAPIQKELENAALAVLRSGSYINGSAVTHFEQQLARTIDATTDDTEIIGVSSGTDALLVSMMALGVRPGDKIITTVYSFFATAGAIARLGAIPVFADIHPDTYNMDERTIDALADADTVGIVPVHLFGCAANMAAICDIAKAHGLWVLEDAAQALGTKCGEQYAGTIGNVGTFSFFPGKNLGAAGDAGAVVTRDAKLATKIRQLRAQGATRRHCHSLIGGNFRMDTLQAALLRVKLPSLEKWHRAREDAARTYTHLLSAHPGIICPPNTPGHTWNQYVIQLSGGVRPAVIAALEDEHIANAIYYPRPLHRQPALKYLGYQQGDFPVAEKVANRALALPINPTITTETQARVVNVVVDAVANAVPDTRIDTLNNAPRSR